MNDNRQEISKALAQLEKDTKGYTGTRLAEEIIQVRKIWDILRTGHQVCENPKCFNAAAEPDEGKFYAWVTGEVETSVLGSRFCGSRCASAVRGQRFRLKKRQQG
jgi:hypothetical protein